MDAEVTVKGKPTPSRLPRRPPGSSASTAFGPRAIVVAAISSIMAVSTAHLLDGGEARGPGRFLLDVRDRLRHPCGVSGFAIASSWASWARCWRRWARWRGPGTPFQPHFRLHRRVAAGRAPPEPRSNRSGGRGSRTRKLNGQGSGGSDGRRGRPMSRSVPTDRAAGPGPGPELTPLSSIPDAPAPHHAPGGELERSWPSTPTCWACAAAPQGLSRRPLTLAFVGYGDESDTTVLELTHNWDTELL